MERALNANYLPQAERYLAATQHLLGQRPGFIICLLDYAGQVRPNAL
jgi:hypothetical protein